MKILVTYFSLSGNTKKIAQAIIDEIMLEGYDASLEDVTKMTPDRVNDFDLIFLGSACHDSDLAEPVRIFLAEFSVSQTLKLAGFVTHATTMPEGGRRNEELYQQWAGRCEETFVRVSQEKGFKLLGYFHCQGIPTPPIVDFIRNEIIPDDDEWAIYHHELIQHPNDEDFEKAKLFPRAMLSAAEGSNRL